MKPLWESLHDGWMDDIKFDIKQINEFAELLKKHPNDQMGDSFRSLIKITEKNLEETCKEYKKIYGVRPNIRRIKQEVEREKR